VESLLKEQLPHSSDDAGLWRFSNGDKVYAAMLRRNTTTMLTADEIHALGLKEVARIEAQMDSLLRELGYPNGSVKDRYEQLETDFQPKENDPRPTLLARYTEYVRMLNDVPRSSSIFVRKRRAKFAANRALRN
jgi:uncharacterized protein (DUF885 family)